MNEPTDTPDFQSLFECSPACQLVLDPDFTIRAVTAAYLQATMTRRDDIVGRNMFSVFPDNPGDADADGVGNLRASLERVLREGTPDTMAVQKYDVRRPAIEGGGFDVRYWSPVNTPLRAPDGTVRAIIHQVEDVTEFVRLRRTAARHEQLTEHLDLRTNAMEAEILTRSAQLQVANDRLRLTATELERANARLVRTADELHDANEVKSRFLAMASHELRTPLTAIEGFTSTMLHRWEQLGDDEKLRFLGIIDDQSHRLGQLVSDLLTLSRVESGKLRVDPRDIDVPIALKRVIRELDAGEVKIACPSQARVHADEQHLTQILVNFISNARKYGEPPYAICVQPCGSMVGISMIDCGSGVPEEFVPHLFETFTRAESARVRADGTGLGLSITQGLCKAQGGDVRYEPNTPRGARFTALLPASR